MSIESLILLTIQLSKQPSESKHDLLPQFSIALEGNFDATETPFKVVYFYSVLSGVAWVKGISIAEQLVSKDLNLPDSIVAHFEFPRSQPSNLIEVLPKKKQNSTIDYAKFEEIFNLINPRFEDAVFMQKSETRIVIRFVNAEVAVKASSIIVEKLREHDYNDLSIRYIQIKELILYRANFLGFQSYRKTAKSHKEKRNQSLTSFVHYKLNNASDKPIILEMVCPTYFLSDKLSGNISNKNEKQMKAFTVNEEVFIVCMTHTDYRLLKIWEPISLPYNGMLIFQKENIENLMCKESPEKILPMISEKVSTIITSSNITHKSDTTNTITINAFIFWDYGSCQLHDRPINSDQIENKAIANVSKNLHKVISNYIKNTYTSKEKTIGSTLIAPFTRILFVPHGSWFVSKKPLPKVWNSFTANDYKVYHYSRKNTVDMVMRSQIEELLKSKKDNHISIYCFVTDDSDYLNSIVSMLRLEGIQDILLVLNPESLSESSSSLNLVKKVYSWYEVEHNQISTAEMNLKDIFKKKDSISIKNKNKLALDIEEIPDMRSIIKAVTVNNDDSNNKSILECTKPSKHHNNQDDDSIELYAKKDLVPWLDPTEGDVINDFDIEHDYNDDEIGDINNDGSNSTNFNDDKKSSMELKVQNESDKFKVVEARGKYFTYKLDLKYASVATYMRNLFKWYRLSQEEEAIAMKKQSVMYYNYLVGEDTTGYDEDINSICNVQVETHTRTKEFLLWVRGLNSEMVYLRGSRISKMLEEVFKYRRLHALSNDWNSEHRLAIVGTEFLTQEERNIKACAMFHFNQNKIIVEIVSLSSIQHQTMLKFIQKLKPKEMIIDIKAKCIESYTEEKWEKIRSCFAFKALIIPGEDSMIKLHCYGFLPLLYNQAVNYIKRNDSSIHLCVPLSSMNNSSHQYGDQDTTNESIESNKSKAITSNTTFQSPKTIYNDDNKDQEIHLKDNIYSISYIFSDREAGIFFFKFEEEFCSYFLNQYDVMIDEQDRLNVRLEIIKMEQSNVSNPNLSLYKITFHGKQQQNVQAARAYMDQFNSNILARVKVFFPRVTIKKHKEICAVISQQLSKLSNTRVKIGLSKETTSDYDKSEVLVQDPLQSKGFINIRSKPEIFGKFQAKINFPIDITITLCGSQYSKENKDILDQVEAVFNSIPSDYIVCVLSIPSNHYMRHKLSVKKEREELIQKYNLVSIRWEESSKSQGSIGIAKIWAFSKNNLNTILKEILMKDKVGGGVATILSDESSQYNLDLLQQNDSINAIPSVGSVIVPGTSSQSNPRLHEDKDKKSFKLEDMNSALIDTVKPISSSTSPPKPTIIHIPDLSLHYVFQGEPLKTKLESILDRIRNNGVEVNYPYQNRSEPHAIIELSGDPEKAKDGSLELNDFIDKAAISLRSIHIILSNEQYAILTGGGEGVSTNTNHLVNKMQVDFGIHMIFNPPQSTVHDNQTLFDLRFSSDLMKKEDNVLLNKSSPPTTSINNEFSGIKPSTISSLPLAAEVDQEMISVQVYNGYSRRTVELAIISSNSSDEGWTWGVNSLLVLVGSNDFGFNQIEIQQLNRGEVLVHSDRLTGKTILRMRPNVRQANGVNLQAGVLTNALLKCLQKANELSLHAMAISAPTDIDLFPDLSPELIRSLTVEAVVEFAKKCRAYLRFTRLVCIELGYNKTTMKEIQKTNEKSNMVSAAVIALEKQIEPAYKDRMTRTLILLIERQEAELIDNMLQNSYNPGIIRENDVKSKLILLTCNVPLPSTFYTCSLTYGRNKGCKTLLVRGLLSSLVRSMNSIKDKLQTTPASLIYEVGFL